MPTLAVPVKRLAGAKTRLAGVLRPAERAALALAMAEDVLDACAAQRGWDVWVVSPDPAVLSTAARRGVRPFDDGASSLLAALRLVESAVPGDLAVLLADLPLLTAAALADALAIDAEVVAARATSDGGTNLLVRRPSTAIPARFGRASFAKHCWAAGRAGVRLRVADSPELAFDLDRPEDLAALAASEVGGRARELCRGLDVAARLRAPV